MRRDQLLTEPLFRAKRKDKRGWAAGDLVHTAIDGFNSHNTGVSIRLFNGNYIEIDPDTVSEATGRYGYRPCDSAKENPIMLYEGDIVTDVIGNSKFVIKWSNDYVGFRMSMIGVALSYSIPVEDDDELTLLGNIWDNPELTNGKKF